MAKYVVLDFLSKRRRDVLTIFSYLSLGGWCPLQLEAPPDSVFTALLHNQLRPGIKTAINISARAAYQEWFEMFVVRMAIMLFSTSTSTSNARFGFHQTHLTNSSSIIDIDNNPNRALHIAPLPRSYHFGPTSRQNIYSIQPNNTTFVLHDNLQLAASRHFRHSRSHLGHVSYGVGFAPHIRGYNKGSCECEDKSPLRCYLSVRSVGCNGARWSPKTGSMDGCDPTTGLIQGSPAYLISIVASSASKNKNWPTGGGWIAIVRMFFRFSQLNVHDGIT